MISFSSSHLDSTKIASIPAAVMRSCTHLRRSLVELVASRMATVLFVSALNHFRRSATAASAAARRALSP